MRSLLQRKGCNSLLQRLRLVATCTAPVLLHSMVLSIMCCSLLLVENKKVCIHFGILSLGDLVLVCVDSVDSLCHPSCPAVMPARFGHAIMQHTLLCSKEPLALFKELGRDILPVFAVHCHYHSLAMAFFSISTSDKTQKTLPQFARDENKIHFPRGATEIILI